MKKNKLREGIRSNKKLKDSFYYFIVDNRIDWAIILGSLFCILPYLASHYWYFILIKSLLLVAMILISLNYLKTWNSLRETDTKVNDVITKLKSMIKKEKVDNLDDHVEFSKLFAEKMKLLTSDYKEKSSNYKSFEDYLRNDKGVPIQVESFLNNDIDLTVSSFSLSMSVFLVLSELSELPKIRLRNYRRLLALLLLVFIFFVIYAIENSI